MLYAVSCPSDHSRWPLLNVRSWGILQHCICTGILSTTASSDSEDAVLKLDTVDITMSNQLFSYYIWCGFWHKHRLTRLINSSSVNININESISLWRACLTGKWLRWQYRVKNVGCFWENMLIILVLWFVLFSLQKKMTHCLEAKGNDKHNSI